MRTVKILSTVFLCLSLISCSSPAHDTDLPLSRFICEFSWSSGGETFTASLSSCEAVDGRRDYVMRILSPPTLSDLSIVSVGGAAMLYMGDSAIGAAPRGYTDIASLLLPVSPLKYLCRSDVGGIRTLCYISSDVRWYYPSDKKAPVHVENGELSLDIIRMEGP